MRARDNGGTPTRDDVQRLRAEASPSTAMEAALEDAEEEENEHDEEESAEEEENDEESDEEDEDDDHDAKPSQSPVPPHALTAHPPRNLSSNPRDAPSPPPQVRVRARFPAAATAAATAAAHGGARRRRLRSVWVFFARARTTAAAATEVPRASFRGTLSSPPSPHDVTFPTRRVFTTPYKTSRDVTRGRYGDRTAIRS